MPTSRRHRRASACLLAGLALLAGGVVPAAQAARAHTHARAAKPTRALRVNVRLSSARWVDPKAHPGKKLPPPPPVPPPPPPTTTPPPPPAPGLHVGVTVDSQGWGGGTGERQDQALAAGAKWSREHFAWDVVEPQRGVWDWSRYDRLMGEAAKRGLSILANPMSTPSWAGAAWNQIPADPTAYADFIAHIVARYGPGGTFWQTNPGLPPRPLLYVEFWNEPYCTCFSYGGVNPARYAALVKASTLAGRAANPGVQYLIEADTSAGEWPGGFLAGMYNAMPDLNRYFDAVAIHPYSDDRSPALTTDSYGFQHLTSTRDLLVAHGAGDKPLWITELGWPTCPTGAANECVTEAQQASYLRTAFDLVKTTYSSFIRAIFIYHYNDFAPANPSSREQWFGLTRVDGSHKPAYDVFSAEAAGTS
ncbi:MAG: beta-xylosidase [Solirubrobacterales bacterium]|nr:beta-xylosidase [Solirubrobacterales bacterium]